MFNINNFKGLIKVTIIWEDGTVTTDFYNDPYRIGPKYTYSQIVEKCKNFKAENHNIKGYNIAMMS